MQLKYLLPMTFDLIDGTLGLSVLVMQHRDMFFRTLSLNVHQISISQLIAFGPARLVMPILLALDPLIVTILRSRSQEVCANSAGCLESSKV